MSADEPLVSIIVPFYNAHQYLAETVASVLAQTYKNFELIIVNDGSSPPSPSQVLRELDQTKINFINHDGNRGLSQARNTAVAAARGELILPLDQDDLLDPAFLAETVGFLRQHEDVDAVYTTVRIFGDINEEWKPDASMLKLMCGFPIQSTVLYWRRVFDMVGGYNTGIKYAQDCDFWIRVLAKGGKLSRIDKPLYHYRKHTGGMSDVGREDEVPVLAEANQELYQRHLLAVLKLEEQKYFQLKREYAELEAGYRQLDSGYQDLLRRYDDVVRRLQKRMVKYQLKRLLSSGAPKFAQEIFKGRSCR
ncbi:MAG TPA: glycosyltransferase [Candidatus Obscuribacterales bacterium]